MEVWILGKYISGELPNIVWEFGGVFSTKEKAVSACRDRNYFIAPFEIDNAGFPDGTVSMPGAEYPLNKN